MTRNVGKIKSSTSAVVPTMLYTATCVADSHPPPRLARKFWICIYYQVMFLSVFCVSHVGNELLISFKTMCFYKPVSLLIGSVSEKVWAMYIVLSVASFCV